MVNILPRGELFQMDVNITCVNAYVDHNVLTNVFTAQLSYASKLTKLF